MQCPKCKSESVEVAWCPGCYGTGVDSKTGDDCSCTFEPEILVCKDCHNKFTDPEEEMDIYYE